ncbi:MAG: dethiobiotin synthase [Rhodocyclaceae bacterium]|nr:dethiobiotin synthase [Rhodocyclaceae bacterium]
MTQAYYITGTDTEIGKTHVSCALLARAAIQELRAAALKPIAAGVDANGHNEDVLRLMAAANVALPEPTINPWRLAEPLSPHIAARRAGVEITTPPIIESFHAACEQTDLLLVEGVGGLYAPLSDILNQPDLIRELDIPVILVVGLRLGCLNHALLTTAALAQEGCVLAGWVGNLIDPSFQAQADNIDTLRQRISAPCLGILPFDPKATPADLATTITLP